MFQIISNKNLKILLLLDIIIISLITLYKFNFFIPGENEFIFSGDLIRPITFESIMNYHIYPYLYNEHGIVLDFQTPFKIPYYVILSIMMFLTPPNIVYWISAIIFPQVFSAVLVSFSIRKNLSFTHKYTYIILPLLPAIFLLLAYPMNYRPYWSFLPFIPGMTVFLLFQYRECLKEGLTINRKISLFLMGSVAILQLHVVVFLIIAISIISFILFLISQNKFKIIKNLLYFIFWFSFPFFLILLTLLPIMTAFSFLPMPDYTYSYTNLEFMSSNANFARAFVFNTAFWPKVEFTLVDQVMTFAIIIFVLSVFIKIKKHDKLSIATFIGFVLVLYFQMGYYSSLYKILADPSLFFSWLFRDPFKINLLAEGVFLFLFSLMILEIYKNWSEKKHIGYLAAIFVLIILIAVWIVTWSPQIKTKEILKPSRIPENYFEASNYLNSNFNGSLIFIPIYGKNYSWSPNKNFQEHFLEKEYKSDYVDFDITSNHYVKEYLIYAIYSKNLELLKKFFNAVVWDESLIPDNDLSGKMSLYLYKNRPSNVTKIGENLNFMINSNYNKFELQETPAYLLSSIDYKYLDSLEKVNNKRNFIFLDPEYYYLENGNYIKPSSKYTEPSAVWSLGSTNDPLHGAWHDFLEPFGMRNWQSDYGKGLVLTWATLNLKEKISSENEILIKEFDFDKDNEGFDSLSAPILNVSIDKNSTSPTLKAIISRGESSGWNIVSSDYLPIESNMYYKYKITVSGKNVNNIHFKAIYFNETKKEIGSDFIFGGCDGTFDWKEYSKNLLTPFDAKYVKIQFWVRQNSELDSYYWIDSVKIFDIRKYVQNDLKMDFDVKDSNNYHLLVRYFINQKGGQIKIFLDEKEIPVNTSDQLNKFVWKDLGEFYLKEGKHILILRNVEGFNAVNLFKLISSEDHGTLENKLNDFVKDKELFYFFEGESDLYYQNATISNKYDNGASNKEVIILDQNSNLWQDFEIIKSSYYKFAIRLNGQAIIKLDNTTFNFSVKNLTWVNSNSLYFAKGKHHLEIKTHETVDIDVILIYSIERNETPEDFFKVKNISDKIINYTKINPTKYIITANISRPLMLNFFSFYDSMWEARIYQNGRLIEKLKPVPLYGVINGFWIETTGENLDIIVQYVPQEWFDIGLIIYVIANLIIVFYLIYIWRRKKHYSELKSTEKSEI